MYNIKKMILLVLLYVPLSAAAPTRPPLGRSAALPACVPHFDMDPRKYYLPQGTDQTTYLVVYVKQPQDPDVAGGNQTEYIKILRPICVHSGAPTAGKLSYAPYFKPGGNDELKAIGTNTSYSSDVITITFFMTGMWTAHY